MRHLLKHLDELNAHISELDDDIDDFMKPDEKKACEATKDMLGISRSSSQTIISVIGCSMERFS